MVAEKSKKRQGQDVSEIRNKVKRQDQYRASKIEKAKTKRALRKDRAKAEELNPKLKEARFNNL
jgi:hypothetical protein